MYIHTRSDLKKLKLNLTCVISEIGYLLNNIEWGEVIGKDSTMQINSIYVYTCLIVYNNEPVASNTWTSPKL